MNKIGIFIKDDIQVLSGEFHVSSGAFRFSDLSVDEARIAPNLIVQRHRPRSNETTAFARLHRQQNGKEFVAWFDCKVESDGSVLFEIPGKMYNWEGDLEGLKETRSIPINGWVQIWYLAYHRRSGDCNASEWHKATKEEANSCLPSADEQQYKDDAGVKTEDFAPYWWNH